MNKPCKLSESYLRGYFDIADEGNVVITIKNSTSYTLCNIKEILNPKYALYERVKIVLSKIIENSGSPSIACTQSNNYDNLLIILAAIIERIDLLQLEEWKTRLFNKRGII